jgi:hypothetical protein
MGIDFTSVSMKRFWNFSDGVVFLFFITLGKEEQQKEAIPEIKLCCFCFYVLLFIYCISLLSLALILNIFKT